MSHINRSEYLAMESAIPSRKTLMDVCKTTLNFQGKNIQLDSEFSEVCPLGSEYLNDYINKEEIND